MVVSMRSDYRWQELSVRLCSKAMNHFYGEELESGAMVGSFIVEHVHFRGVMSVLHFARDVRSGRPAAVKVLRPGFSYSGSALRRFQQEAAVLGALRHPHIVEFLEYGGLIDGRPYLAMEWLEGRDLAAELSARGPLSAREALAVLEPVASALAAAHRAGIIHRDLKAQNVMVQAGPEEPRIKLVDFGIAKPLAPGAATVVTSTGRQLGTPVAMAPEQIRGVAVDARTDIYALGVLIYQLLTGQLPFQAPTAQETEELHLHAPAPRVSDLTAVPPEIDGVVLRCLAKRPEDRYPSVDDVLADLRWALGDMRSAPAPSRAVALYLDVIPSPNANDAALDLADTLLEQARRALSREQLFVVAEGASFLLATTFLASLPEAEREIRSRLIAFGLELLAALESARGSAAIEIAIVLHTTQEEPRPSSGQPLPAGEELLAPARWASGRPAHGVAATAAMLVGLSESYRAEASPEAGDLWRILS